MASYCQLIPTYSVSQKQIQMIVLQNILAKSWMTCHGLALYYSMSMVNIEVTDISSLSKVLPILQEIEFLVVYHIPGVPGSFLDGFILLINELPTQHRILIVGNFNLDQLLPEHVAKVDCHIQNCNLSQCLQCNSWGNIGSGV